MSNMKPWEAILGIIILVVILGGVKTCQYQFCRHVIGADSGFCLLWGK